MVFKGRLVSNNILRFTDILKSLWGVEGERKVFKKKDFIITLQRGGILSLCLLWIVMIAIIIANVTEVVIECSKKNL